MIFDKKFRIKIVFQLTSYILRKLPLKPRMGDKVKPFVRAQSLE